MKEWKLRQKIYHAMHQFGKFSDDLASADIIENFEYDNIVKKALEYPTIQSKTLHYPAKSYSVAVTYAYLLEKEFNEKMIECLDDSELLFNNDPYFKKYSESKKIYDKILEKFPFHILENKEECSEDYRKTIEYFYKEFLLHEDTKIYAIS
jgi:hypothetical protein